MKGIVMQSKYWNYKTTHEVTGLPLGTLYALVSAGRIPHVRLGPRHVLFPVDELLKWIEQHRVTPTQIQKGGIK
jgi:excisionase family DNA binding protein